MATRYNPISQQVEVGLEPMLTSPMPLLLATHIRAFEQKPDITTTTSGDLASYDHQTAMNTTMRHVLLMNPAGDQHLLRLIALEAPAGNYDAWRIELAYQPVQLPLGLAGGKVNRPLPGRLVYRDWYRTKMVMSVDLTTGKEEALADGILPSVGANRWLGYGDTSGAYVVRDAAGKVRHSIRFGEQVLGPVLAADGMRLLGSVYRPGPDVRYGSVRLPGAAVLAVGIFDSEGREIVAIPGYDDANWAPDGKLIATGKLTDPGLFEIDPRTKTVRPIDAGIASPSQPCISADGRTIAFITGNRIWLVDRDGSNLRQVLPGGFSQQRPVFSPDGTKIAAVICNTIAADMTGEVFVIDLVTKEVTPLRNRTGQALVPDTSSRL